MRHIPLALFLLSFLAPDASAQAVEPRRHRALLHARDGERSLQAANFDEAAGLFRAALELDPDLTIAHCGLGHALMGLKQYPRAVQAFLGCREALRKLHALQSRDQAKGEQLILEEIQALRDSISRLDGGGIKQPSAFERERIEQRIQELELRRRVKTGQQFQTPAEVSLSLGSAYFRQDLLGDAEREYRASLQARPGLGEAHNNLAAVLLRTGRPEEAEQEAALAEQSGFAVSAALKADIGRAKAGTLPAPAPASPLPAPSPPAAAPEPLRIVHEPVPCVVAGRHPRLTAEVTPADAVSIVRVRFTTDKAKGWFTVSLSGTEGQRETVLPAPKRGLRRFRYRIEAIGVTAEKAATPEHTVEVVLSPADCGGRRVAETAVPASSLIVEGPPDVRSKNPPRVPAGFSSQNVAGQIGVFDLSSPVAVVSGVVAGAGMVAAAMALSENRDFATPSTVPPPPNNELSFLGSDPPPGSTVSLSSGRLSMTFRVMVPTDIGPGTLRVTLNAERSFGPNCVTLQISHNGFRVAEAQTLVVGGPPSTRTLGACGSSFTTIEARASLFDSAGRVVLSTSSLAANPSVRYSFVP